MSSLGLSGLASGVDTSAIVEQLMAVDRQATLKYTNKQTRNTAEQAALKSVAAKLTALRDAVDALEQGADVWTPSQAASSSDPSHVDVTKTSGAGIGGHSIQVDRLASSAQRGFAIGDLSAGASLTIDAGGTSTSFTFDPDATAADVVTAINARADSPVYAAVVKNAAGEERLVLSARSTGEGSRFTVTSPTFTADTAYESPAGSLNALYRLDGATMPAESETNVLDNAIPGLRLTLKGVTTAPASVTVAAPDIDRDAAKTKIKAVVDAYNALVDTTRGEITERPVVDPSTTSELGKGTLFGDTGLNAMLSNFRNSLRDVLPDLGGVDDLGDIGIGVPKGSGGASSDDAKAGRFTIDDEALTKALTDDWTQVASFMDAFAAKVDTLVDAQTGKPNSLLDERVESDDRANKLLSDQLRDLNARLDQREARLKAQFAAMESAMQNAQNQQAWLTAQLGQLNSF